MQVALITTAVFVQVLPKHCIPDDWSKCHTILIGFIAIDIVTPFLVVRRIKHGEIGPTACDVFGCNICKEGREPVSAQGRRGMDGVREPICVEMIVLSLGILDELDRFKLASLDVKALKEQSAFFYTLNYLVALYIGRLGGSCLSLAFRAGAVCDS